MPAIIAGICGVVAAYALYIAREYANRWLDLQHKRLQNAAEIDALMARLAKLEEVQSRLSTKVGLGR